jgi:hypothetical protein
VKRNGEMIQNTETGSKIALLINAQQNMANCRKSSLLWQDLKHWIRINVRDELKMRKITPEV